MREANISRCVTGYAMPMGPMVSDARKLDLEKRLRSPDGEKQCNCNFHIVLPKKIELMEPRSVKLWSGLTPELSGP